MSLWKKDGDLWYAERADLEAAIAASGHSEDILRRKLGAGYSELQELCEANAWVAGLSLTLNGA